LDARAVSTSACACTAAPQQQFAALCWRGRHTCRMRLQHREPISASCCPPNCGPTSVCCSRAASSSTAAAGHRLPGDCCPTAAAVHGCPAGSSCRMRTAAWTARTQPVERIEGCAQGVCCQSWRCW
jgi:hypothetical protein